MGTSIARRERKKGRDEEKERRTDEAKNGKIFLSLVGNLVR